MPMESVNYRSDLVSEPKRQDLKPLQIIQPQVNCVTLL
jgi:Cu2+-containing amine oxidase